MVVLGEAPKATGPPSSGFSGGWGRGGPLGQVPASMEFPMMQKELGEVLTLHLELPQRMEILEACWGGGGCHGDRGAGPRNPREAALPSHLVIRALHWTSGPAQGSLLVCHLRASARPKSQIWGALTSRCSLLGGPPGNPLPVCGLIVAPGEAALRQKGSRWEAGQEAGSCRAVA